MWVGIYWKIKEIFFSKTEGDSVFGWGSCEILSVLLFNSRTRRIQIGTSVASVVEVQCIIVLANNNSKETLGNANESTSYRYNIIADT